MMTISTSTCRPSFFDAYTQHRPLVIDGAMGTAIQNFPLTAEDFGGADLEGCNELLCLTRPDVVKAIHASYLQAGADVIETNSFGSSSVVLAEYGIPEKAYELSFVAAQLARAVADDFSTAEKPRLVAGSIGPTTKLCTLGHIGYDELKASFITQVEGLIVGGADFILLETCQDLLQVKAGLAAVTAVEKKLNRPIPRMVSVTVELTGTLLVGCDIATVLATLEPFHIDALGLNCATGPKEMEEHIRYLCQHSPFPVSCVPNAGIPENRGGQAHYHLSPEGLKGYLQTFVGQYGVQLIGGCCGTCPTHIEALATLASEIIPAKRNPLVQNQLTSLYSATGIQIDNPPLIVGERTNANGSKKFKDLLALEDYDALVEIGKDQVRKGAHLLDVCTAYVGRNEERDMCETVTRFNQQLDVPLMIDSTETNVLEASLKLIAGRAIVNSINLEDGLERIEAIVPLCKEFGAAVVALTIDEEGMAKTAQKKLEIAERIYNICVHEYGMRPADLVFDTLTFTLGSGDAEFRKAGIETLEGIRLIREKFPDVGFVLGISNISFGLAKHSRPTLNSLFMHYAVEAGLTMAIFNSAHLVPLHKVPEAEKELCRRLIFDEPALEGQDPLMEFMSYYQHNGASAVTSEEKDANLPKNIEDRLQYRIVDGNKTGLEADLALALETHSALAIVNNILLEGMKTVGDLFGRGEMQLPFVLQSAETMKKAVAFLEPYMEKELGGDDKPAEPKGTCVLATVKGDVHDIGKNLVDIILTNNGYKVHNLGIKQLADAILTKAETEKADLIAMSGLLVKSTAIMKDNLELMQSQGWKTPVVLGGAALTRHFVETDCQNVYDGAVVYAQSAFDTLNTLKDIMEAKTTGTPFLSPAQTRKAKGEAPPPLNPWEIPPTVSEEDIKALPAPRSVVTQGVAVPNPPFWGTKVVDVPLEAIYPFLNEKVVYTGHWSFRRGAKSKEEYSQFLAEKVEPILANIKKLTKEQNLLKPQVVYGYFPAQADGDSVVIYEEDLKTERLRFEFPRGGKKNLCLADYLATVESGVMDVLPMQIVTVGHCATEYTNTLFANDDYTDYFYFHGFAVEMAEALAEYWHAQVRKELAITQKESGKVGLQLLKPSAYQGCRYSFGYPACPNLEDQRLLMDLLQPERIGITMTESFLLEPEQSTSAIVLHHSEAYYFDVTNPTSDRDEMREWVLSMASE